VNRFDDQVVIVTGGGQGLGAAMAYRFAAEGATVVIGDIDENTATAHAEALRAEFGRPADATGIDVTDSTAVTAWIDDVAARHGRVDVLINNAGIIRDNRITDISDADWHAVVDVSLTGGFYCARAVIPHMRARGYGRIVSFSSMSWRGNFGQANYVAAKAGIVGLTRTIALETARDGITANAIAPGLIETPMLASMNAAAREKLVGKVPQRVTGHPTDIAEAATFLASPAARYITGVVLDVDGGLGIGSSIR
jgi:3-oxoacyl-[acyl-carrier protein] reductase